MWSNQTYCSPRVNHHVELSIELHSPRQLDHESNAIASIVANMMSPKSVQHMEKIAAYVTSLIISLPYAKVEIHLSKRLLLALIP